MLKYFSEVLPGVRAACRPKDGSFNPQVDGHVSMGVVKTVMMCADGETVEL